jgi:hypothetical protein
MVPFGFVSFSSLVLHDILDENVHHANVSLRFGVSKLLLKSYFNVSCKDLFICFMFSHPS